MRCLEVKFHDLAGVRISTFVQVDTGERGEAQVVLGARPIALGATRQRGCAIEDEESEIGMVCIAAPIRDDSGDVVAAVGIAGPLTRLSKKSIAAVMPHVIATADLVSARLGYRGRMQA